MISFSFFFCLLFSKLQTYAMVIITFIPSITEEVVYGGKKSKNEYTEYLKPEKIKEAIEGGGRGWWWW